MLWLVWVQAVLLQASPVDVTSLTSVLKALGEEEKQRFDTGACKMWESTLIEELDSDKKVIAQERRTYAITLRGHQWERILQSREPVMGELSRALKEDRPPRKDPPKPPFHPDVQKQYQFKMANGQTGDILRIDVRPTRPEKDLSVGYAEVDAKTGLLRMTQYSPSKYPVFLSDFQIRTTYSETPCGNFVVATNLSGEGGMLFIRARFRVRSEFKQHQAL